MTVKTDGAPTRVFITGSADGLGLATARTLLADGHQVVVHVRGQHRLPAVQELLAQGAVLSSETLQTSIRRSTSQTR